MLHCGILVARLRARTWNIENKSFLFYSSLSLWSTLHVTLTMQSKIKRNILFVQFPFLIESNKIYIKMHCTTLPKATVLLHTRPLKEGKPYFSKMFSPFQMFTKRTNPKIWYTRNCHKHERWNYHDIRALNWKTWKKRFSSHLRRRRSQSQFVSLVHQ